MNALQHFYVIRSDIYRVRDADGVAFLRDEAAELERLIDSGSASQQALQETLNDFESKIDFPARMDALEVSVVATKPAIASSVSAALTLTSLQLPVR